MSLNYKYFENVLEWLKKNPKLVSPVGGMKITYRPDITIRLTNEDRNALKAYMHKRNYSMSAFFSKIVTDFLEAQKCEPPPSDSESE